MNLEQLVIEVTRRCNLTCDHCLRGEAENMDFDIQHLRDFLEGNAIDYISSLSFTGGEPSLVPHILRDIRKILTKCGVEVGSFYIATNGQGNNDKAFIMELMEWYLYCSDNEATSVNISNDEYHDFEAKGLIDALSFVQNKFPASDVHHYRDSLVNQGMAEENGIGSRMIEPYAVDFDIDYEQIQSLLYLNCGGRVLSDCDLSYSSQNEEDFFISVARSFSIGKCVEYNMQFETDDEEV